MLRSITKPRVFYKNCGNVYSFGKSINSVSSKLIKRSYVSGSNYLRNANTPPLPSYFSNPTQSPSSSTLQSSENTSSGNNSSPAHDRPRVFLDLTVLIGFGLFAYMAFDNYNARITLEKKLYEHSLLQVKAISNAQLAFNNARRKRETQILQERAFIQKREMKMLLHIALLRKQLADAKMESGKYNFQIYHMHRLL